MIATAKGPPNPLHAIDLAAAFVNAHGIQSVSLDRLQIHALIAQLAGDLDPVIAITFDRADHFPIAQAAQA